MSAGTSAIQSKPCDPPCSQSLFFGNQTFGILVALFRSNAMNEAQLLKSEDVNERRQAAESLSMMGPDASPATVELVMACDDPDEQVQEYVVAALEELGPPLPDHLQRLAELLDSTNSLVCYWALTLLGRSEGEAKPYQDSIANVLTNGSSLAVQERAAWALGKMQADSSAATQALRNATESPEPRLSRLATSSLETLST